MTTRYDHILAELRDLARLQACDVLASQLIGEYAAKRDEALDILRAYHPPTGAHQRDVYEKAKEDSQRYVKAVNALVRARGHICFQIMSKKNAILKTLTE
jgi:hypothetical protein